MKLLPQSEGMKSILWCVQAGRGDYCDTVTHIQIDKSAVGIALTHLVVEDSALNDVNNNSHSLHR